MTVKEGRTYNLAPLDKVYNYLSGVKREKIMVNPAKIRISNKETNSKDNIHLVVNNGSMKRYAIRRTFMYKLMRWFHVPTTVIPKLRTETLVEVCNDFLANIKSSSVFIKFEDDEALTITSTSYTDIPDVEILDLCRSTLKIDRVSRNDFVMRAYSKQLVEAEPIPGDLCGFGYNIFNSETGFMALHVAHYILRYTCSNGAVAQLLGNTQKIYHVNQPKEKILQYITESIKNISEKREKLIYNLGIMKDYPVIEKMNSYQASLGYYIGQSEAKKIINEFERRVKEIPGSKEHQDNKYSFFNFITNSAKRYGIIERMQMEEFAGRLIYSE